MAKKNKQVPSKAASKNNDAAFFTFEEDKKDLGTPPSINNNSYTPKNTLYIYKDKTTCRVTYDSSTDIYNEVTIGQ